MDHSRLIVSNANFSKILGQNFWPFLKLIPPFPLVPRKERKFSNFFFPPSSLLFLAEYFNKTLRELMGMKKVTLTRFVYKIQKEETGIEVKFSIDRENSNNDFSIVIRKRSFYLKKLRRERYKSCISSTSIFRVKKKKRKSIFDFARFNNSGRIMNGRIL